MDITNLKNPFTIQETPAPQTDPFIQSLDIAIEDVGFSSRTTNVLLKNNIKTLRDLSLCTESTIKKFKGIGAKSLNELFYSKNIDRLCGLCNEEARNLSNVVEHTLNEREQLFIVKHYGLTGKQQTLDEMGKKLSITRERMRQIGKVANKKIRQSIILNIIDPNISKTILQKANENVIVDDIPNLDPIYNNVGILRLYDEIFDREFLFSDRRLKHAWVADDTTRMLYDLQKLDSEMRKIQKPTPISEISQKLSIQESFIQDLKSYEFKSGIFYPHLTINQKILQYMQERVVPVTIDEIASALQINPAIVRSRMPSIQEATNIGRSIYALTSNGYRNAETVDIIYDFIKDQGQPVKRADLINYVSKYKIINDGSILAAIDQNKERFTKFSNGTIGLSEWGIPSDLPAPKEFELTARDALLNVIPDLPEMFTNEMARQKIIETYGDKAPSSVQTMYKILDKLVNDNILIKYNYTNTAIFKLNPEKREH